MNIHIIETNIVLLYIISHYYDRWHDKKAHVATTGIEPVSKV